MSTEREARPGHTARRGVGPVAVPRLGGRGVLFGMGADLAEVVQDSREIEAVVSAGRLRPVRAGAAHERPVRARD